MRVQRHIGHAEGAEDLGRPLDRGRDVVQLEIDKDVEAALDQRAHRVRTRRGEQLQPHLGDTEPRPDLAGEAQGDNQVVDVERQRQSRPDLLRNLSHRDRLRHVSILQSGRRLC